MHAFFPIAISSRGCVGHSRLSFGCDYGDPILHLHQTSSSIIPVNSPSPLHRSPPVTSAHTQRMIALMQSQALVLGSMQHFSKQFHHGLRSSASLTCRRDTHVGPRERTKGTPDTRVGEGERASEWQAPGRDGQTTIATLGPSPSSRPNPIHGAGKVSYDPGPGPGAT